MPDLVRITGDDAGGEVWRLALDDPARANAFSPGMVAALGAAFDRVCESGARAIILESTGTRFCAGFGMDGIETANDLELRERFVAIELLLDRIRRAPGLTVACVNGAAIGAGADLVASCDYRLGSGGARFSFPGVRFGVILGTRTLAQRVGAQRALEILVEGKMLDAASAYACNLLSEITDSLDERSRRIAEAVVNLDAQTVRSILHITRTTAPEADLAGLLQSTLVPGLAERMREHARRVAAVRAERVG